MHGFKGFVKFYYPEKIVLFLISVCLRSNKNKFYTFRQHQMYSIHGRTYNRIYLKRKILSPRYANYLVKLISVR